MREEEKKKSPFPNSAEKKRWEWGELKQKILEVAAGVAAGATIGVAEAFLAVVTSPYGASRGQLERRVDEIEWARQEWVARTKERAQFYKLVHKLREEGLVIAKGRGRFAATPKGKLHWLRLRKRSAERLPSPAGYGARREEGKLKIMIFDIPEREKRKRAWLRDVLRGLGFTMLQKSVWTGTHTIPEDFLEDMANLRLTRYVEIFEISKTGSLEKLV